MSVCGACGAECFVGARFCSACGAALAVPAPRAVERKVVTTLFCDIVGFTALCEQLDPEESDGLLRTFYATARQAIELCGGVVEKFVGDAVVGVFGVPTAHEDDAERAVVAGLRLRDRLASPSEGHGGLRVRIGINTGTAVVRLDVVPGSGEGFLVGDAVNTAARLQKLAPAMGVVVGGKTHELTANHIVYEALAPAKVKGKRHAVECWLAVEPASRVGVDLRREYPTPLVDREVELGVLRGLLKKVRASSHPQFAIVVGEAGIGKSRLLFEFLRYVDSRPSIVRWRQGRCPAYGDGLTFWALGEVVREQLGVAEFDGVSVVEAKLAEAVLNQDDGEWLAARLRPLLGLEAPPASREENFAAWLRFLEHIACDSPAVLVLEDLHWASEAMLAFLRYLVVNSHDVPLLCVGTTRPELFRARPDIAERLGGFGAAHRGVQIDLKPLSESETQELVARVGRGLGSLEQTREVVVRRSAGNPLFVEQLVSHLQAEPSAADVVLKERVARALPDSLQSLIAARLDELPPERKILLADAAVVGDVFWTGAVAALDHGDREAAERGLDDLARHDMVRRERESTVAGESEFAFRHSLIRDVAYAQLTRADRAVKHAAVARWIEETGSVRADEVAEIVAHHYLNALELAEAVGDHELCAKLLEPTLRALKLAGDYALPLDVAAAERHYARAVELAPGDAPERPHLLVAWGDTLTQTGRFAKGAAAMKDGIDALRARGDLCAAAMALPRFAEVQRAVSGCFPSSEFEEMLNVLEAEGPSPGLVAVLVSWATHCLMDEFDLDQTKETADRAMTLARSMGLPTPIDALHRRGVARCQLGDRAGLDDLTDAIEMGKQEGLGHEVAMCYCNLADMLLLYEGPRTALLVREEGLRFASGRGDVAASCYLRTNRVGDLIVAGEWERGLALADELEAALTEHGNTYDLVDLHSSVALVLAAQGRLEAAETLASRSVSETKEVPSLILRLAPLASLAAVRLAQDRASEALALLTEREAVARRLKAALWSIEIPNLARVAIRAGGIEHASILVKRLVASRACDAHVIAYVSALIAEARGSHAEAERGFAEAAKRWGDFGAPYELAMSLLARGRCLVALGKGSDAAVALAEARSIFARLGARPAVAEADALSAVAGALVSAASARRD